MAEVTARELSRCLRDIHNEAKGLDKLKIAYRPYICPFDDLLTLVEPGERVFDLGCGSGQFALLLSRYAKPTWIGGAEIDPALVKNATDLFKNSGVMIEHEFKVYDGRTFPESVAAADMVFLTDVFHHIPTSEQANFLRNLHGAMRTGARLILKDIDAGSLLVYFNKLHDLMLSGEIGNELSASRLLELAREAGFELVSKSYRRMFWYPHFTLVLKR